MKQTIKTKITLLTPSGKVTAPVQITYDNREDSVNVDLVYNGSPYCGRSKDWEWAKAYAALQMKLPRGIYLACCMTCRHGNICPYGGADDELFCTKDMIIKSKEDICLLFDKNEAFGKREVLSYACCDHFEYQRSDTYTYNGFLYQLEQKYRHHD